MNRSIFQLLLIINIIIGLFILGVNFVYCMPPKQDTNILKVSYDLIYHYNRMIKFTNLGVNLSLINDIFDYYSNNIDLINWKIVKLKNPNIIKIGYRYYYDHFFLQLYIENYLYRINLPFTTNPRLNDDYLRFCIEENNIKINSQCLTFNITITDYESEKALLKDKPLQLLEKDKINLNKAIKELLNSKKFNKLSYKYI